MAKDKAGLVDLRSFKSVAVSINDRGVKKVWSQIGKLSPLGRDELSRLLIANSLVVDEEKGKLDRAEGGGGGGSAPEKDNKRPELRRSNGRVHCGTTTHRDPR